MKIDREQFKNEEKKLKRHHEEQQTLTKILTHIKNCQSFDELYKNPISMMYGFHRLKHNLSNYYSFNLKKHSGTIRLIVSINQETNSVKLEFISMEHYEDFKKRQIDKIKIEK